MFPVYNFIQLFYIEVQMSSSVNIPILPYNHLFGFLSVTSSYSYQNYLFGN